MRDQPTAKESSSPFPAVLACIDAGSNAVRFAAAEFSSPSEYRILESRRVGVRLGHGVFLTGRLGEEAQGEAIAAFKEFGERMEALGAKRRRAVATSAVREARDGAAFIERARREAGVELQAISGAEEARLVHMAVSNRVPLGKTPWLLVDLGGGSVEVSLADESAILWSESHTMGAVRLLEELTVSGEDPGRFLRLLEEYATTLKIPRAQADHPAGYIATGGNAEALAELAGAPPDASGVRRLPMAGLRRLIELLARTPYLKRVEELGLRGDRADVILPAAIIYHRLGVLAGALEVVVAGVGVKEGLLLDLAEGLAPAAAGDRKARQAYEAALAIGRKYHFDEAHGRHVAALSAALFDQTLPLHGLKEDSRRILQAAGLLHDIGSFVSTSGHHRHSLYLIQESGLPGYSRDETLITANVARYHRKGEPKPEHESFARLSKGDRQRVLKLAALLRLADALDREHEQRVRSVKVKEAGEALRLCLECTGDLLLEQWAIGRKADFFEKVYDRKILVEAFRGEAK